MDGGAGQIGNCWFPALIMTSGAVLSAQGSESTSTISPFMWSYPDTNLVDVLQLFLYTSLYVSTFLHIMTVHVLIHITTCHPRCPSWVDNSNTHGLFRGSYVAGGLSLQAAPHVLDPMPIA